MSAIRQLKFDGFEICEFLDLPGKFPPHSHAHWLIGMLLEGSRRFKLGPGCVELNPGQIITLNPYQIHGCEKSSTDNGRWICFHLHEPFMKAIFPGQDLRKPIFHRAIHQDYELAREFTSLAFQRRNIQGGLMKFLLKLAESEPESVNETCVRNQVFADFRAKLDQDADFSLSLEVMARRMHLNKYSFLRRFKREMGLTPHRYLENLRLLKAALLLEEGWPVAKTAAETGYYDQAHFSKAFKAITGFPPAAARPTGKQACPKGVAQ